MTDQVHPTGAAVSDRDSAAPAGMRPGEEAGPLRRPRAARSEDVAEILRLVRELADYERSLPEVTATTEDLAALLFGSSTPAGSPAAHCLVIDADEPSAGLAGMALWFLNASTWTGRHGIYLEDLYVSPEYRGRGYGRAFMATLAALCRERGYARLEWSVLDWNTPALDFYSSLGARAMDEWTVHRIAGDALAALADEQPGRSASGSQP